MDRVEEIEAAIDSNALPSDIQKLAVKNYHLWRQNPNRPSLHFRRLKGAEGRFSIRVGNHHRAIGRLSADTVTWVWIGTQPATSLCIEDRRIGV